MTFLARIYTFKAADAFILIYPLYAVMFVDAGLNPAQIGLALAAWSTTAFVLEIPAGVIADRWPRRWVLALAQLFRLAGYALWLLHPHLWGFVGGFLLWGAKSAFTSGTFEALVYDELKAAGRVGDYTRVIGRADAVQFAAILAASGGAALLAGAGYGALLQASLAACAVAAVLPLTLPRAPPSGAARPPDYLAHLRLGLGQALRAPALLDLIVFIALVMALGGALDEFWTIFASRAGLSNSAVALFLGAMSAGQAVAAALAHRARGLPDRAFYLAVAAGGVLLAIAAGLFRPASVLLLIAFSGLFKVVDTVFEGRLQHAIPDETRATLGSVKGFAVQAAITALYLGFGPLAASTSYRTAFLAFGVGIVALGLAYAMRRPRSA
ncbi:MFS transporter [Caulobacter sp. KR2-114]|uniref:MFS transporter n=1 Tax=Caulobacter sp. KR2-114 TaxID=3400912 RepID=UPI003C0D3E44